MGVKLGCETKGYTRFSFLSEMLVRNGYEVDLITTDFQHWDKKHRDTNHPSYKNQPYNIKFIHEPGYSKNLDLKRIKSHAVAARKLREFLEQHGDKYNLIYAEIPPNDVARCACEFANTHQIPFIVDINDLWPEAMKMAVNIPILSDIAFAPFSRDARYVYNHITAAVGTSDEYTNRATLDSTHEYEKLTVYVGNNLDEFYHGAKTDAAKVKKPQDEFWVIYAGTLGASYDIKTLITASKLCNSRLDSTKDSKKVVVKILGDGPDLNKLECYSKDINAPVEFIGYTPYDEMAAYLCASDITVNSLKKDAAQSIVTKIGDYLASGKPMINTGSSPEFCNKVISDGFGLNVSAENAEALSECILSLYHSPETCAKMGSIAREIAKKQFDRNHSYTKIVDLINRLSN